MNTNTNVNDDWQEYAMANMNAKEKTKVSKKKQNERIYQVLEVGMIAGLAEGLFKTLGETMLLSAEEKAPYLTMIEGLSDLLMTRTRPVYDSLMKKGN